MFFSYGPAPARRQMQRSYQSRRGTHGDDAGYAERATFLALKGSSSQRFVSTMLPGVDASAIEKSELSKSGGQAAFGLLSPVVLIFGSALH